MYELCHCLCLTIDSLYNLSINSRMISSLTYGGTFWAKFLHSGSDIGLLGDFSEREGVKSMSRIVKRFDYTFESL